MDEIGPQYAADDPFKARARLHQSRFRVEVLNERAFRDYGSRLTTSAALAGKNFYTQWPGVLEAVDERFGVGDKKLCWDMLASDHIPFNLFVPMKGQPWAIELVRAWVGPHAARISGIHIEWAPAPASSFLDDNTSFDAYITYATEDGKRGAIGIETKFTEGPYSWGKAEKQRMFDASSAYLRLTASAKLYRSDVLDALRTPKLKQLWRNQLLGEAMKQRSLVDEFVSVIVFPSGNAHYASASNAHHDAMLAEARARFVPVTFEALFKKLRGICDTAETALWIDYLERRYVLA